MYDGVAVLAAYNFCILPIVGNFEISGTWVRQVRVFGMALMSGSGNWWIFREFRS